MTDSHAENRQTNGPYASLRAAQNGDAAKAQNNASAQPAPVGPDYLAAEAEKLESFKQALYAAFVAAPKVGIPTAHVDLAATYTSALRLQLSLKGYGAVPPRAAKAPMFGAARK